MVGRYILWTWTAKRTSLLKEMNDISALHSQCSGSVRSVGDTNYCPEHEVASSPSTIPSLFLLTLSSHPLSVHSTFMDQQFVHDVEIDRSAPLALHTPTEVCENVIDMLYSDFTRPTFENIHTLRNCALVCRAWRIRSQRMLFYFVQLTNSTSLHRLSTILDTTQHLRDYVYQVELTGYHLHDTTSIFALFPAVFAGKLPCLKRVRAVHLLERNEQWCPRTPGAPKARSLPHIPLHSRFPRFLSSFTAVSDLVLETTTFHSFTEFARMLRGLPNLEKLACNSVRWITAGGAHPGADFTKQPDWGDGRQTLPLFAPKLRLLRVCAATVASYCNTVVIMFSAPGHCCVCRTKTDMVARTPSDIPESKDSSVRWP